MKSYHVIVIETKKAAKDAVVLILTKPLGFDFSPGQHVMLGFSDGDIFKPFSISSSPTEKKISITIKNVGAFTSKLCLVNKQQILLMKGPFGKNLIFDENVHDDVVFLAGGTGVCPFMSSLKYALEKQLPNKFAIFYSGKNEDELLYNKELKELANKPNISLVQTLTRDAPKSWNGETGRIDTDMLQKYVDDPQDKVWYVCGSSEMVMHLKKLILSLGVPKENIR